MRTAARMAAIATVIAALAGCWTADEDAPDPEPPAPKKMVDELWPAEKAARITYDPVSGNFTLTNVSPHVIWYTGEGKSPVVWYELELPTGEWVPTCYHCKSGFRRLPLAPGERVPLGRFWINVNRPNEPLDKFRENKGDVSALPARVYVWVCSPAKNPDGSESSAVIYSNAIVPAR